MTPEEQVRQLERERLRGMPRWNIWQKRPTVDQTPVDDRASRTARLHAANAQIMRERDEKRRKAS